jgi:hypothetical protein
MMALLAGKSRIILLLGTLVGLGVVVALLTGSGPRTYDDAMRAAVQAHAQANLKTAERYYATAFEKADSVGNGNRAVVAGDAVADLVERAGTWPRPTRSTSICSRPIPSTSGRCRCASRSRTIWR